MNLRYLGILVLVLGTSSDTRAAELSCPSDTQLVEGSAEGAPGEWCEKKGGIKHGPFLTRRSDGSAKVRASYSEGKLNGKFESWFENGNREKKGSYTDGEMTGHWTRWHENGKKKDEVRWKNGKPDGAWESWHENGKTKAEGRFEDGKETGEWTTYYPNGRKEKRGMYFEGKEICQWSTWDESGTESERTHPPGPKGCGTTSFWNHFSVGVGDVKLTDYGVSSASSPYFKFGDLFLAIHPEIVAIRSWLYLRGTLGVHTTLGAHSAHKGIGFLAQGHLSARFWYLFVDAGFGGLATPKTSFNKAGPHLRAGVQFPSPLLGILERLELGHQTWFESSVELNWSSTSFEDTKREVGYTYFALGFRLPFF